MVWNAYLPSEAYNIREGTRLQTRVLKDQGNLISISIGISEDFLKRMNLVYAEETQGKVRTAAKDSDLTRLGLTERFIL